MPTVTVKLSVDRCREIIGEAMSRYWAQDYACEWNQSKCVFELLMPKGQGEHDVRPRCVKVTPDTIAYALSRMIEGRTDKDDPAASASAARIGARVLAGAGSSEDYDCVLQVAVFDRIVYG